MAKKIQIEITCPHKNFYSGEAEMLIVRTGDGDMAVMAEHEPYVCPISIGEFKIIEDSKKRNGAMAGGFMHVANNKVSVISDSVEWASEIDVERAEAAKKRAEDRISSASEETDIRRARHALKKANNRIRIAKK